MNKVLYTALVVLVTAWSVFFITTNGREAVLDGNGICLDLTQELVSQVILTQEEAQVDAINRVSDAVVGVVNMLEDRQQGEGSGVVYQVVDGNTYIVTNEHVIAGGDYFEVVFASGERHQAEVVGSDIFTDLAVLRIMAYSAQSIAKFGQTEELQIGQTVIALGNPLGLNFAGSATSGIVSGHDRSVPVQIGSPANSQNWEMTVLQTDTAINPGNSGGALINLAGEVVGINSMKIADDRVEGMSFSIPTYVVLPIIADLEQFGEVIRPTLGITIRDLTALPERFRETLQIPDTLKKGLYVNDVLPDSLAAYMGLQVDDVILAIGDVDVTGNTQFRKELFNFREGDEITLRIMRSGVEMELTATVVIN